MRQREAVAPGSSRGVQEEAAEGEEGEELALSAASAAWPRASSRERPPSGHQVAKPAQLAWVGVHKGSPEALEGLDESGRDWTELERLNGAGLAGRDWTRLDRTGLGWMGLDRIGRDWMGLAGLEGGAGGG